jgi:hypothetical protein
VRKSRAFIQGPALCHFVPEKICGGGIFSIAVVVLVVLVVLVVVLAVLVVLVVLVVLLIPAEVVSSHRSQLQ